mgnify:CR=1 FL=1
MPRLRRVNRLCSSMVSGTADSSGHGSTLCSPTVEKILCRSPTVSALWQADAKRKRGDSQEGWKPWCFYPFSPISAIYLTNCTLSFPCDTNFTPKCSHSFQQFGCILLFGTENVNVGIIRRRNVCVAEPLADYADRYTCFQSPCSERMPKLMKRERLINFRLAQNTVEYAMKLCIRKHFAIVRHQYRIAVNTHLAVDTMQIAQRIDGFSLPNSG